MQAKETAFKTRKDALADLRKTTEVTIDGVLTEFKALLPLTAFDAQPTDAADEEKQIVNSPQDIRTRPDCSSRTSTNASPAVQAKLAAHDAEAAPDKRIQLLTEAARLVLGDPFVLVPCFALGPKQAAEWTNAYENRAKLLDYQKTVLHNDFAVDDWLYTRLASTRSCTTSRTSPSWRRRWAPPRRSCAPCSSRTAPMLHGWRWSFHRKPRTNSQRSCCCTPLITRRTSTRSQPQCGLLLDEWTEVIPAETETTGLTFQFDKPNAEPPQAILLATPPQFTGSWNWSDLVQTLHETLDMARVRAVEPQQIDQSPLSVFLPATILATTWRPITIAADLSVVNNYASQIS